MLQNEKHILAGRRLFLPVALLLLCLSGGFKWGFFAHKKINRTAVFTLPAEMLRFYKSNLDYLTEHAVSADKRRYIIEEEAARHYFDTEHYGEAFLDENLPDWEEMEQKFPAGSFRENGILPWHILRMTARLTRAFRERDSVRILRYSADLGHYLADAHVPLHTTMNYNGQLTGQTGIHGFWESRIPELFSHNYDFLTGKAVYISNLRAKTWNIVRESYRAVDSVLAVEKALSETFPSDRRYTVYLKNNRPAKNYSEDYSAAYQEALQGMIERRMIQAILEVGSFWFTAWVNAGQPSLEHLEHHPLTVAEQSLLEKESRSPEGRQMLGRKE